MFVRSWRARRVSPGHAKKRARPRAHRELRGKRQSADENPREGRGYDELHEREEGGAQKRGDRHARRRRADPLGGEVLLPGQADPACSRARHDGARVEGPRLEHPLGRKRRRRASQPARQGRHDAQGTPTCQRADARGKGEQRERPQGHAQRDGHKRVHGSPGEQRAPEQGAARACTEQPALDEAEACEAHERTGKPRRACAGRPLQDGALDPGHRLGRSLLPRLLLHTQRHPPRLPSGGMVARAAASKNAGVPARASIPASNIYREAAHSEPPKRNTSGQGARG